MKVEQKIVDRFNQLIIQIENLIKNRSFLAGTIYRDDYGNEDREKPVHTVEKQGAIQWKMSCLYLLEQIFTKENYYVSQFKDQTKFITIEDNYEIILCALGILKAAKDDFINEFLSKTRVLIEAQVFDEFLEQAEHLLNQGYYTAAAVIAGSVLEDGLRKLCVKNGISLSAKPKLDTMNADLAKASVYNLLKQKQITALADLRNKAAHGLGGFTKEDVEGMIKDVRRFMEDYFS